MVALPWLSQTPGSENDPLTSSRVVSLARRWEHIRRDRIFLCLKKLLSGWKNEHDT